LGLKEPSLLVLVGQQMLGVEATVASLALSPQAEAVAETGTETAGLVALAEAVVVGIQPKHSVEEGSLGKET
jgi:hypothetical protein